ncbi:MAG: TetR/AcrR family transcriptional regulator [Pseudomonadota bacterium]
MSARAPSERTYHHGDLAPTLMDLALTHISAEGVQKLSLRALAREAGVSATAPYRHFPSKRCLLAALATRGFKQLEDSIRSGGAQALKAAASESGVVDPLSPRGLELRLLAAGRAYVAFAQAEPTTYGIMFGSVIDDFSEYEQLQEAASASYAALRETLEDLLAIGLGAGLDIDLLGGTIWAGVHGIADLLLSKSAGTMPAGPTDPARLPEPMRAVSALRGDVDAALTVLCAPMLAPGTGG